MQILERLKREGLIPVVVIEDAADALDAAKALLDGGLGVMEITMRTAAGIDAIRSVAKGCPEMLVGAGTVLTVEKAKEAVDAGAKFIVTPGFNDTVVAWCIKNNVAITPGAVTPTEIDHAMGFGLHVVKFFPANIYGGLAGMQALHGPYSAISFIPTGGISGANLSEYADKPYIHAIGGGWLCPAKDISAGNFAKIRDTVAASVNTLLGFDLAHIGVNCETDLESENVAKQFAAMFGLDFKPGNASNFAGAALEAMKAKGLGERGHIAVKTNSIERAMYHLQKRGFEADASTAKEKNGKTVAIYLKSELGGFAVHLLQK